MNCENCKYKGSETPVGDYVIYIFCEKHKYWTNVESGCSLMKYYPKTLLKNDRTKAST